MALAGITTLGTAAWIAIAVRPADAITPVPA
jgi:hypothetical protein